MAEKITGKVYILSLSGDAERVVDVLKGQSVTIDGEFGSLVIDAQAEPPKIQGKGNICIKESEALVRTSRMELNSSLEICLISGTTAGTIYYSNIE